MLKRLEELYLNLVELHVSPKTVAAACKLLREARECYELILLEERLRDALRQLGQPELPELRVARLEEEDEPDANVDEPDENGP